MLLVVLFPNNQLLSPPPAGAHYKKIIELRILHQTEEKFIKKYETFWWTCDFRNCRSIAKFRRYTATRAKYRMHREWELLGFDNQLRFKRNDAQDWHTQGKTNFITCSTWDFWFIFHQKQDRKLDWTKSSDVLTLFLITRQISFIYAYKAFQNVRLKMLDLILRKILTSPVLRWPPKLRPKQMQPMLVWQLRMAPTGSTQYRTILKIAGASGRVRKSFLNSFILNIEVNIHCSESVGV